MSEPSECSAASSDLEAVIRLAGGYVQPSEDLRPRVLETARTQQAERHALRRLWLGALVLGCVVLGVSWLGWQNQWPAAISADNPRNASTLRTDSTHERHPGERHWETADSFRDLRLRQARLFKFPF